MVSADLIESLKDVGYSIKDNGGSYEIGLDSVDAALLAEAKSNFEALCADSGVECAATGDKTYTIK